jgi:hypothetical protein
MICDTHSFLGAKALSGLGCNENPRIRRSLCTSYLLCWAFTLPVVFIQRSTGAYVKFPAALDLASWMPRGGLT